MKPNTHVHAKLASLLNVRVAQIDATVNLLDGGATVPFIARYRKEITGGLDDTQLRKLESLLKSQRALEDRRRSVLSTLNRQGTLTTGLREAVQKAESLSELEALYAPHKIQKQTKADKARQQGLEPIAIALAKGMTLESAMQLLPGGIPMTKDKVKTGVIDIAVDTIAKNSVTLQQVVHQARKAPLLVRAVRGKEEDAAKWTEQARPETVETMPPHRALGLLRALKEGVVAMEPDTQPQETLARALHPKPNTFTREAAEAAWKGRVGRAVTTQALDVLRERAEDGALDVFRENLKNLLLAAPAGPKNILGLDPGLRTGIKAALIDGTGKILKTATLLPHRDPHEAAKTLKAMAQKAELIAVGNGTGSRETTAWLDTLLNKHTPQRIVVSEAGASVYSASELAAKELPELDVTLRGAVSIARRLQDPLAELVKIDPKALGVGQYQHDVDPGRLQEALDGVVQDAVAAVGVDANTASAALLTHIPGIGPALAKAIVEHRNQNGPFTSRRDLKKVKGLGAKAFEQAAGFLRIFGTNPLDATAIHPESYPLAERIAKHLNMKVADALGHPELANLKAEDIEPKPGQTLRDVLTEMAKPGRDPRPQFRTARLESAIVTIRDLKPGMRLEGTVSNVTAFGAFVDLGVHQDGLVHISELSETFVSNPADVVKVGDVVRVRVLDVDTVKNRIALSMKPERTGPDTKPTQSHTPKTDRVAKTTTPDTPSQSPFADLNSRMQRQITTPQPRQPNKR